MIFAEIIVDTVFIYLTCGAVFAVWFVVRGIGKFDEAAKDSGVAFRLIIFFGAAAFWVFLLQRLMKGAAKPQEKTAHRTESEK